MVEKKEADFPILSDSTKQIARAGRNMRSGRHLRPRSAQRSPTSKARFAIFLTVNVRGPTAPDDTSSQLHGADTGAPGLGLTAYTAANVALYPFRPVST